eukprot:14144-Heterococcus_DN1.PRE.2
MQRQCKRTQQLEQDNMETSLPLALSEVHGDAGGCSAVASAVAASHETMQYLCQHLLQELSFCYAHYSLFNTISKRMARINPFGQVPASAAQRHESALLHGSLSARKELQRDH